MARHKPTDLEKLKKKKDSKYRKEAYNEALTPVTDLNAEIRQSMVNIQDEGAIQAQINSIKADEKENYKRAYKAHKLRKEQVTTARFNEARVKEIDKELKKPDYKPIDTSAKKNYLKALQGKNYNIIIDDGFKKYAINTKEFKEYFKKGQDASLPILKNMRVHANEAIEFYRKQIEDRKNTATKGEMRRLVRIKDSLEKKLTFTIDKNIQAMETGNAKVLDDISDSGDKAYSILFKVVGFSIDRIGI